MDTASSFPKLLAALREGDPVASNRLFALIYGELCRLAQSLRRSRVGMTLDTAELVHEAYLHLQPFEALHIEDRVHFFRLIARAMRQVLAREARYQQAQKRGGDTQTISLHDVEVGRECSVMDRLTIEQALDTLGRRRPRASRVVEYRLREGRSVEEIAEALGVSTATVKRDWRAARAWLRTRLASAA